MKVRSATREDSGILYSMLIELAEFEEMLGEFFATEENLAKLIFDPKTSFDAVVIEDAGQVVGMAIYYISFVTFLSGKSLFLEDVYVPEKLRGRGYGKSLLKYLAQKSLELGCVRMEWNVLKNNVRAITFYESLDAKALNDWVTYRMDLPAIKNLAK